MKPLKTLAGLLLALGSLAGNALSQEDGAIARVGVKLWHATVATKGSEITGDGLLWQPTALLVFPNHWWVSGRYLRGEIDYEQKAGARKSSFSEDNVDAEVSVGRRLLAVDVGVGLLYATDGYGSEGTAKKCGPVVSLNTGDEISNWGLGWYAMASWMFTDLADDWDAGEHYTAEAGLTWTTGAKLGATLGYHFEHYYDSENNLRYSGVAGSVSYTF